MDQLYDDHNEPDWLWPEFGLFQCRECRTNFVSRIGRPTGLPVGHCGRVAEFIRSVENEND